MGYTTGTNLCDSRNNSNVGQPIMNSFPVLCCSVLRREVETILKLDFPDLAVEYIDSMLHLHPVALQETYDSKLSVLSLPALVIIGDCGPSMHSLEKRFDCVRTPSVNCCELLLGRKRYIEYRRKKIFILLPEWTRRWKDVFKKELGFSDGSLASSFMRENCSSIEYLDTGVDEVPNAILKEIEEFLNMQVIITNVGLDNMRAVIFNAVSQLKVLGING
jgi:hypothetical protein